MPGMIGMTRLRGGWPSSDPCAEATPSNDLHMSSMVGAPVQSAHPGVDQEKAQGRAIVSQGLVSLPYSTVWGWNRKLERMSAGDRNAIIMGLSAAPPWALSSAAL